MADDLKAKGNSAFSAGQYDEAVKFFTEAIALQPENHVLYSNRSAAHAALNNYEAALTDAQKTVSIKGDWPKGYAREGAAYHGLRQYDQAIEAYKKGLALDPANDACASGVKDAEQAKEQASRGGGGREAGLGGLFSSPESIAKLAMDPRTRTFFMQPDFQNIIQEIQRDPSAANKYIQDPRLMQCLGVLLNVNVQSADTEMRDADSTADSHKESARPSASQQRQQAPPPPPPVELSPEEKAAQEAKAAALKEKEAGNEAYKKRDFQTALKHYAAGMELDPQDVSFFTNRAAVHFEMGNYQECIKDCDDAVEKGQQYRADFKMIARALARKGNALVKMGDLEQAIQWYNKSLTEHRTADTLKRLNETERELKEKRQREYEDPAKAEEARELGNTAFRDQKYPEAVGHYTEAIKRNPRDHRTYSNRSACYTKLAAFQEALKDAEKCIELAPEFAKGYTRKGAVQFFMKEYEKALATYQKGLEHDPENEELKDGVTRCIQQLNRVSHGLLTDEELKERQAKAMADPEIQNILMDPIMRQVLNDFQSDPKAAAAHQKNPDIMKKVQKLISAGIVQIR